MTPHEVPLGAGAVQGAGRPTCYRCFRPAMRCICARCRPVANRTFVHVLQHPRERFHPFGTARIVELTLQRAAVHVAFGSGPRDTHHPLRLPADTALLYPGPGSRDIATLAPHERPANLLVLDGTWRQSRQLVRDNPWVAMLPKLSIDPPEPSRYRIRKEPAEHCLSTVESVLLALQLLEPGTPGLAHLRAAFEGMIDQQIAHDFDPDAPARRRVRAPRESRAVPPELRGPLGRLLVVYAESSQISTRRDPRVPELLQAAAVRPATGERLDRLLRPAAGEPEAAFLARMGLSPQDMDSACGLEELGEAWRAFRRADDVVVAWNASSLQLLSGAGLPVGDGLLLKAAYANVRRRRPGMLEQALEREGIAARGADVRGRAGERLGNALAMLEWLRNRPPVIVGS